MTKYLLFLLYVFCLATTHAGLIAGKSSELFFHQVFAPKAMYAEIDSCGQFDYNLRLTNLRNTDNGRQVGDLPTWDGHEMGGVFNDGSIVDPEAFNQQWGHKGASSDGVSADELGICFTCTTTGNPWDFVYKELISEENFGFQKYVDGKNVEIDQPQVVDFDALGSDFSLVYSNSTRPNGLNGEVRLFIPFASGPNDVVSPNKLRVGKKIITVPNVQSSANYDWKQDLDPASAEYQQSKPGICVVFHPVSGNTPHDSTPESSQVNMSGASMSSFRNKEVLDYNASSDNLCPVPDWGYEGYYQSYEDDCVENIIPNKVDRGCRCRGDYKQIVCHSSKEVFVMDCSLGSEGEIPVGRQEGVAPFMCEGRTFKIQKETDGKITEETIDCCNPGEKGYAGQDIGYACTYAVQHPDFEQSKVINWTTGESFNFVQEK